MKTNKAIYIKATINPIIKLATK